MYLFILFVMLFIWYDINTENYSNPYEPMSWSGLTCHSLCLGEEDQYDCMRMCDDKYINWNDDMFYAFNNPYYIGMPANN